MADCIVVIVSLVSSTQEKAAMHYTITSIALLLLCGAVIYPNEGLVFPRGMPAVLKELNVLDPFKYPFSVAVIDQFYDAEFDDSIWTDASEICAPKVPGSFILEWLFGIDANQKVFFWIVGFCFFVLLHLLVLLVAKLAVLEKCNRWFSFAVTNGVAGSLLKNRQAVKKNTCVTRF